MKIKKVTTDAYLSGFEKVCKTEYQRKNIDLIVDTISIGPTKTVEVKQLYKDGDLIKTILVAFDKTGKRVAKYLG